MNFYANMHNHSTHSDGKYTPTQLAQHIAEEGYRAGALTDHDTATGFAEFKAECDRLGIACIFGVEFTAPCPELKRPDGREEKFHLTSYHFDPEYPEMKEYLYQMGLREKEQTRVIFEDAVRDGLLPDITWQEVLDYNQDIAWLCNEHVFRAMKHKGLVTDLDYYDFYTRIYRDRWGTIPPSYPFKTAAELIQLVHDAGGVIFVAHPHNQLQHMDALIEMGIDGLEAWHPFLTEEEKAEAYRIGLEKNLYISGGSDHYGFCGGMYGSFTDAKSCPFWLETRSVGTTEEMYKEIKDRQKNRTQL